VTATLPQPTLTDAVASRDRTKRGRESFGGWTRTFIDPRLCAAIVDRLTFGGNIIETSRAGLQKPAQGWAVSVDHGGR
jgi:hypothetical protein